ncbi:PH domain-containing protein [Microbacterium limosum]|uniref:PH domain-containing protein n=1 Tax=Microbacterium limosum TaxID=3079935 RepID=A0AAU0MHD1_9MICO|nr:PH domain-containing protein [Microbacterium sp. Y20]WOQ69877.1 PH domain-containing protein [Microbacterium sp. Y20]
MTGPQPDGESRVRPPAPVHAVPEDVDAAARRSQETLSRESRSDLSDGQWHRLHPLTPLFRGGLFLVVVIGIVLANMRDRLVAIFLPWLIPDLPDGVSSGDPVDWVIEEGLLALATVVVLAALVVIVGGFYLSWRFHTFRITDDDVEVRQGILFRSQRRAPLDRVQGVNLTRPLVARLAGLAKLEVVGAGTDANVKLEYLTTANAERVRADILRLASGRRLAERVEEARSPSRASAVSAAVSEGITGLIAGAEGPDEEPESVVHIPTGRLVASQVLGGGTLWLLLLIIAMIVGGVVGSPWVLIGIVPAVLGIGAYGVSQIVKSLRYSIAPTRDGLRVTFGLFTTVTEIIPPGRVHAVEVRQSIFWRPFGWWTIKINRLTGKSLSDTSTDQFTTVLPVGLRGDVERVLRLLLPDVPEGEWGVAFEHGVLGPRDADPFVNTPPRGWWVRPLSWRRNGYLITPDALLVRRGWIWRSLALYPFARLQSVALHQGPLDRAARLATLRPHTVAGPVYGNLAAVDREGADALFAQVAERACEASRADRSHRWAVAAPAVATPAEPRTAHADARGRADEGDGRIGGGS